MGERVDAEFGRLIEQTRKAQGLTRREVSKSAGLHDNYLYRIEKKGAVPRRLALIRLLGALKVPLDEARQILEMVGEAAPADMAEVTTVGAIEKRPDAADEDYWTGVTDLLRTLLGRSFEDLRQLERDLFRIVPQVVNWWKDAREVLFIPRHGPDHHLEMLRVLCQSFRVELRGLSLDELRVLLASIWLHDIGLALGGRQSDTDDLKRLTEYEQLLGPFLDDHSGELGLSDKERRAVWNVCRHHRNITSLDELAIDQRAKAIIALLRLSDVMAPSPSRMSGRDLLAYVPLPHDISSDLHRNIFVTRVHRDERNATLIVHIISDPLWGELKLQLLSSRIVRSVQATLDRLVATIVRELRTNLFFTDFQWIPVPTGTDPKQLEKVLDELGTERSPNAARVFDSLIATLEQRLSDDDFSDAMTAVDRELRHFIGLRPFHAQIRNVEDTVAQVLKDKVDADAAVPAMRAVVRDWKTRQLEAGKSIAGHGRKALSHVTRFVVFGYSNSVIGVLAALREQIREKSVIYVCECRNKSLYHDYRNSVDYCDGLEYAQKLRRSYERVQIISDASVSHYLRSPAGEGGDNKVKTVVLLGADGIDHSGDVSGTIGTATIAAAAHVFGTDVYIVAESGKIRGQEWRELERDNEWLTTDVQVIAALRKAGIKTGKPSNERVPAELITKFITEHGVLTPDEFRRRYSKQ